MWLLFALDAVLAAAVVWNAYSYSRLRRSRRYLPCGDDEEDRLPPGSATLAFVRECLALWAALALFALVWLLPRRRGPADAPTRIVLAHGLAPSAAALWLLGRRLGLRGFEVWTADYGVAWIDPERAAGRLQAQLDTLRRRRPGPVHVVAHGAGGLVARECLRRPELASLGHLLTLGTPHQGTMLFPPTWPGLGWLHPTSPFMNRLNDEECTALSDESTAISSEFDATILPPECADYPHAFNVAVRDAGHFAMLFSPRVFSLLLENLEAESSQDGAPESGLGSQ